MESAVTPLLAHDGYDLVLVEYIPRGKVLRLFIDHPEGITLDDCAKVSRVVGDLLDAEGVIDGQRDAGTDGQGIIDGQYTLEVSSPGLDRPLVRPAHFQRFVGQTVRIAAKVALTPLGQRSVVGKLVQADEQEICVETDGERHAIRYDTIDRARLVPEL